MGATSTGIDTGWPSTVVASVRPREVAQHAVDEPQPPERRLVVGEGQLVVGAAGVVVVGERRQARPRRRLEVVEVGEPGEVDRLVTADRGTATSVMAGA